MQLADAEKVDILQLVEQNWHASCQEVAEAPNTNHIAVCNHLEITVCKQELKTVEKLT